MAVHFVTGAAGFISNHLCEGLLQEGHTVYGVDNFRLGTEKNLALLHRYPGFKFVPCDASQRDELRRVFPEMTQVDMVWHMAANSDIGAGARDPDVDYRHTFLTTYNTLEMMRSRGFRRVAFASSSAIYGEHAAAIREETGPLLPISNYGAMKLASEAAISAATETSLDRAWFFRFPNVVGARSTHGVIYDFIKKLRRTPGLLQVLGDGSQQKPYLHVTELVRAMRHLADTQQSRINVHNIAPVAGLTTVKFIATEVVKAVSPQARIEYTSGNKGWPGDVPFFRYSIDRLLSTGFTPSFTSDQGVLQAIRELADEN